MAGKTANQKNPENAAWETEASYENISTLEELTALKPFKTASDSKGGSYTAAARVPSWLERKIVFLTESKLTPYEIKGDCIRDAIYVGLKVLSIRYENNPEAMAESKMAKVLDAAQVLVRLRAQVKQFQASIKEFWEAGDTQQAVDYLEEYIAAAVELPDKYQKEKTLQLLGEDSTIRTVLEKCNVAAQEAVTKRGRG